MKITRIVALLGLVFLSCLSDVVTGGRWASCSRYFSSRGTDLRCRESFEPVCGTDGVTYPNECSLCMEMRRCKTVDKQHDGRCVQASCSRYFLFGGTDLRCRESFEPVCGTDGVTYPNECSLCMEMRHKVVEKKHDGRCVQINCAGHLRANDGDDRICTREYNPICATNGITYANQCKFCTAVANGADIDLFRLGECLQVDCSDYLRAKDICTFEYEPVCGSDGKTYRNKCQFCYSVQRSNKLLFLKRLGGC